MFFRKKCFSTDLILLSISFNSLANLIFSSSVSFNDTYPSCISFKKTIGKEYSPKL